METEILLGLGSNVGDRVHYLTEAIRAVQCAVGRITAVSRLYETEALLQAGMDPQRHYLNAAVKVESKLTPFEILNSLVQIEAHLGRVPKEQRGKWQPRTIDLDILTIGSMVIESQVLTLPHPELHRRAFVLAPLCDIAPDWIHPIYGLSPQQLMLRIGTESIIQVGAIPSEVLQSVQAA